MHNWTTTKPIAAGAYYIRGFRLCEPDSPPALVEVADDNGELVCNLHESNSTETIRSWSPVAEFNDEFEWLGPLYAAPVVSAQPSGNGPDYSDGPEFEGWVERNGQAAPVAKQVVMPARREPSQSNPYLSEVDFEWNLCLDEVTRLNAADQGGGQDE